MSIEKGAGVEVGQAVARPRGDGGARNGVIDAFRGVAIVMVMVFHYAVIGFKWEPDTVFRLGRLGVEVFFVISGIVIAMTALRAHSAIDFMVRRCARIYPTFVFCVTATYFITLFYDPVDQGVTFIDYIASISIFGQRLGYKFVDGVYWSLAVELQFYAVVVLGIILARRRFWIVVLGVLLVGAASRFVSKPVSILLFSSYSGFFLFGMSLWHGVFENNRTAATLLGLGGVLAFLLSPEIKAQWPALVPISILAGLLILGFKGSVPILSWIGRISYPLYLLHEVLGLSIIFSLKGLGLPDAFILILVFALFLLLAWGVHRFVEEKSQKAVLSAWRSWQSIRSRQEAPPAIT